MKRLRLQFVWTLALVVFLFHHSTASGQSCTASLKNNIGDVIQFTAQLNTTDPNESGEGESMSVSTQGGESQPFSDYGVAVPFAFLATIPNETILGAINGYDGDETCTISNIFVNHVPAVSIEQKKAGNSLGITLVLTGLGIGTLCAIPAVGQGACAVLLISGSLFGAEGAVLTNQFPADPPDSNYTVIAEPVYPPVPHVTSGNGVTVAEADAFNALYENQIRVIGLIQAAITAGNRAQSAHDAGNQKWEVRQIQAAQLYVIRTGYLIKDRVRLLARVNNALTAAGFSFTVTPSDVLTFEQQVAASGLPSQITSELNAIGASPSEIATVQNLFIVSDANQASGAFPNSLIAPAFTDSLLSDAAVLSGVEIEIYHRDHEHGSFDFEGDGHVKVAVLSSATFDATTIDPSSLHFGPDGASPVGTPEFEDVNGDGKLDFVISFKRSATGLKPSNRLAVLTGKTQSGSYFSGAAGLHEDDHWK